MDTTTNIVKTAAADLKIGDTISHWSPTGGFWKVGGYDRQGRRRLVSDLGAVRYFTDAQIDEKGAYRILQVGQKFQ